MRNHVLARSGRYVGESNINTQFKTMKEDILDRKRKREGNQAGLVLG